MTPDDRQDAITVRRMGESDKMHADRWAITTNGETVATVSYDQARRFWLGKISLAELVNGGEI